MPVIHATVTTDLAPADALRILTDFGPGRAQAFPNVDQSTLVVHEVGDSWADVTEGNKLGWERERYDWDVAAGTITAVTTESNLWAAGSRWDYRITPDGTGSKVQVRLERHANGWKGHLVAALIPLLGARTVRSGVGKALGAR
ncbi:SRPBCC family protein [Nakamurella sp.]|uniref:SRPBCC family protein n=1 Tax=Nakamurella sp. TaxID=1869182 RepID=UPI003B3B1872